MKFRLQNIKNIFQNKRLAAAFAAVKFDMDTLEDNHNALKMSTNDWIVFLDAENRQLKMRLAELERKTNSTSYNRTRSQEKELEILRKI